MKILGRVRCHGRERLHWHGVLTAAAMEKLLMKRAMLMVALVTTCVAGSLAAQEIIKPIRYTWIASSCETWNCAAAAMIMANGKPDVLALPTGQEARPWIVLRRVEEGSIFIPEDEPFTCDVFATLPEANSAFQIMDTCRGAIVLTVPDGRSVIASLQKCGTETTKRRAVGQ